MFGHGPQPLGSPKISEGLSVTSVACGLLTRHTTSDIDHVIEDPELDQGAVPREVKGEVEVQHPGVT